MAGGRTIVAVAATGGTVAAEDINSATVPNGTVAVALSHHEQLARRPALTLAQADQIRS